MKNKEAVLPPAPPEKIIPLPDTDLSIGSFHSAIVDDNVRALFLINRAVPKEQIEMKIKSKERANISSTITNISIHVVQPENSELLKKLTARCGKIYREPKRNRKKISGIPDKILERQEFISGHVLRLLYTAKVLENKGYTGVEIYNDRSTQKINFGDDFFYFAIRVCLNYAMGYYNTGSGSDQQTTSQVLQQW